MAKIELALEDFEEFISLSWFISRFTFERFKSVFEVFFSQLLYPTLPSPNNKVTSILIKKKGLNMFLVPIKLGFF